jgi:hypothetical protein
MTKNWDALFFEFRHLDFLRHSTFMLRHSVRMCTAKVFSRTDFERRLCEEESRRIYGVGDVPAAGDSLVPPVVVDDSMVEAGLVASVVAVGGVVAAGLAAGSVVSVFCSHAARRAALARMQIYFFIVLIGSGILL